MVQARLPEGRMTVEVVNCLLLASKTEYRLFDAVVLSWEVAAAFIACPVGIDIDGLLVNSNALAVWKRFFRKYDRRKRQRVG